MRTIKIVTNSFVIFNAMLLGWGINRLIIKEFFSVERDLLVGIPAVSLVNVMYCLLLIAIVSAINDFFEEIFSKKR